MTKKQKRKHRKKLRHRSNPTPTPQSLATIGVDETSLLEIKIERL